MKPFYVRGTERAIGVAKINYDGDLFFTGSADGLVNLWQLKDGERIGTYKTAGAVKTLDVTDNSELMVTGTLEGSCDIFEVLTGKKIGTIKASGKKAKYLEFSYGDEFLLIV